MQANQCKAELRAPWKKSVWGNGWEWCEGGAQWRKHQVPWLGMVRKGFLVGRGVLPWWSSAFSWGFHVAQG